PYCISEMRQNSKQRSNITFHRGNIWCSLLVEIKCLFKGAIYIMNKKDMNNPTEGYEDTYIIEEERASFSKREWKVLIILRILLLLALIAGLFGIFGGGIIAQRTAEGKHFKIEYPGLARKKTPFKLIISF